ncbi:hypothetical protein Golob_019888 [Gossypium lobatum]|uniref:RNase H type-1 domain-containing protein n=1 Tax=Gossypium lobatum TaxID=34289 RepID=A0A7J8L8S8_9ROSI|nr:hypothetical protein [Gossypium lobatum]
MRNNFQSHFSSSLDRIDWPCLFGIIVWRIWKNQNLFIFQGISWSVDEIIKISYSWTKQYSSNSMISYHKARSHLHNWPLPNNWVSLNTDGSVRFDKGNCTILEAELWGILDGLNLILDRRFERVLIQTDSIEAINVILEDSSENSNFALVRKIHHILKRVEQWKIQYIPRKENLIADNLAKSVRTRRLGLRLFKDPRLRV